MIGHGIRHRRSIDGATRWFESIGLREPKMQAQISSVVEAAAGAAVLTGAAAPLAVRLGGAASADQVTASRLVAQP
jgi:putative oxidoreductase